MVGLYTGVFEFVPGGGMGLARYFIALLVYIRKSGAWRYRRLFFFAIGGQSC